MGSDYLESIMNHSGIEELELDDTTTKEEYKEASSESRARNLAMELSKERKRLKQELSELQTEVEDLTPTTPTGTVDWYVKWVAMILAVIGVFMISANFIMYGQIAYILSSIGWIYVGMAWSDRAIMIGSSISGTAVAMNLVASITI
jgi:ATP-dependent Zn protease